MGVGLILRIDLSEFEPLPETLCCGHGNRFMLLEREIINSGMKGHLANMQALSFTLTLPSTSRECKEKE